MRLKGMLGIVLLSTVGICFTVSAFADDSTISSEEAKRLKAENAKLKKALEKRIDDESINTSDKSSAVEEQSSNFWGAVGLKGWNPTLSGTGASGSSQVPQISLSGGYSNGFANISYSDKKTYNYKNLQFLHGSLSLNLGYQFMPSFSISLGIKANNDEYLDASKSLSINPTDSTIPTIGVTYSHEFQDSPFSISAVGSYGRGSYQARMAENYTGSTSTNITQTTFDLNVGYAVTRSFKLGAFYRMEGWSTFAPTGGISTGLNGATTANLESVNLTLGGLGVGASYAF
jgi:hypothetical protein